MQTTREVSVATTRATSSPGAFLCSNTRCAAFAALILMLFAIQPALFVTVAHAESSTGGKALDAGQWSVQVDRVDPGDIELEPSFEAAIYENLLEELGKTKQFKQLLRSGDRNAVEVPHLLILKTTVQKYTAGSQTKRAVTTVAGATKLNVDIQLLTPDGHLVFAHAVEGDVRFMGDNLRATHNLAHNVAAILKRSTLTEPATLALTQDTEKISK